MQFMTNSEGRLFRDLRVSSTRWLEFRPLFNENKSKKCRPDVPILAGPLSKAESSRQGRIFVRFIFKFWSV